MKLVTIFLVAACVAGAVFAEEEKYTTKYDNINVDEILRSDRLFFNYFKCLMDTGKCVPAGNELKRIIPDALKTGCAKCSEKQKKSTENTIRYLIEHRPKEWTALQAKYDPGNIYLNKYKAQLENGEIIL